MNLFSFETLTSQHCKYNNTIKNNICNFLYDLFNIFGTIDRILEYSQKERQLNSIQPDSMQDDYGAVYSTEYIEKNKKDWEEWNEKDYDLFQEYIDLYRTVNEKYKKHAEERQMCIDNCIDELNVANLLDSSVHIDCKNIYAIIETHLQK